MSSNSKPTLLSLPDDVILEILYQLDPCSIILFRSLCRRCAIISRIFSVWSNALRTLQNSVSWPQPRLEKPPLSYSACDLESIVVKMVRLKQNWTSDSPNTVRTESLPLAPHNVGTLVSGGRWFLTGSSDGTGRIWYSDLDAEIVTPMVLVQGPACTVQRIILDIDGDSEWLQFTMAVMFYSNEHARKAEREKTTFFWTVKITNDGKDLTARFIRSFSVFGYDDNKNACLYGDLWLRGRADTTILEVFDWTVSTSKAHRKAVVHPDMQSTNRIWTSLRLLPNRRILAVTQSWVAIFDYPELTDVALHIREEDLPVTRSTWRYLFTKGLHHILPSSPQFPYQRGNRVDFPFLVHESHIIHSFKIHSASVLTVKSEKFLAGSRVAHRLAILGWRWGVSHTLYTPPLTGIMRLTPVAVYSPLGIPFSPILRETDFSAEVNIGPGPWYFDEQSGRLIVSSGDKLHYHIIYFV